MERDLLERMLASQKGLERSKDTFQPGGGLLLALLLRSANGGPTPLPKLDALELGAEWCVARVGEDRYLLQYEQIVGVKFTERDAPAASSHRAGFF